MMQRPEQDAEAKQMKLEAGWKEAVAQKVICWECFLIASRCRLVHPCFQSYTLFNGMPETLAVVCCVYTILFIACARADSCRDRAACGQAGDP